MLKTTILALFLLVNLAFTRSPLLKEDVCEREARTWKACFDTYINKTIVGQATATLTSSVSPGYQHIKIFENVLSCIGDLHCKGQRKMTKFQLDTASFVFDKTLGEPAQCAQDTRGDIPHCILDHQLVNNPEYNGEILTCAGNILDATECTEEEKRVIMGAARAQNDFMEIVFKMKKDASVADLFDDTFDPTKYH